jgi:hypothetical protein
MVEEEEYIYQSFSRIYHQKEMKITGVFDRMSVEEKIKPKAKGVADPALSTTATIGANEQTYSSIETQQTFPLDKRA